MKRGEGRPLHHRLEEPLADVRLVRERFRVRDRVSPVVERLGDFPLRHAEQRPTHDDPLAFNLDDVVRPAADRGVHETLGHAHEAVVQDASLDFHLAPVRIPLKERRG
eukprot:31476-Pelagococcus_subviridis.AAC.7